MMMYSQFHILEVSGDGNCFYYACWLLTLPSGDLTTMLSLMEQNEDLFAEQGLYAQKRIREEVYQWLVTHKNYASWIPGQTVQQTCVQEYLDDNQIVNDRPDWDNYFGLFLSMIHEKDWAGFSCAFAFANAHNQRVKIHCFPACDSVY